MDSSCLLINNCKGNVNLVEWSDGMEQWNGLLEWSTGLECHAHKLVAYLGMCIILSGLH